MTNRRRMTISVAHGFAALLTVAVLFTAALPVSAETTAATTGVTILSDITAATNTTIDGTSATTTADIAITSATTPATTTTVNDSSKTYTITEKDGKGVILEEPTMRMFWEYPELPTGQQREGTFRIVNKSKNTLDLSLSSVDLPYDDEEALTYLTVLHIVITRVGGGTVYQGAYSDIAGEDGMHFTLPSLEPGKTDEYKVTLRCAFDYTSEPERATAAVNWEIRANAIVKSTPVRNNGAWILGISLLVLTAACIALGVLWRVRTGRSQRGA